MHLTFILLIVIDQITKAVFVSRDFSFLGLHLHQVRNYGLPFGFDLGTMWNFILLFIVYVIAGWFILRISGKSFLISTGKSLFLAGAASNLADRLIYGYVRDFIDLDLGFVFNLADIFIVVGLAIIVLTPNKNSPSVENLPPTGKT